jgi:hypothetical protein
MLHVVFALDRSLNFFVVFKVNEPLDGVLLRKTCNEFVAVFVNSSNKVVRNSDVQDAVWSARQNIYLAACHRPKMKDVDGGDKSVHDNL